MVNPVVKAFQLPVRVRRIFAAVALVMFTVRLIVEPSLPNALWVVLLCPMLVASVVQPKSLQDGRSRAWAQRHPILLGIGAAVFAGIGAYLLLYGLVDGGVGIPIAIALGLAYGAAVVLQGRRRGQVAQP